MITVISIELQEVIRHMMSPNPNQRPTVNQLLHHPRLKSIQKRRQRFAFIKTICKKIVSISTFISLDWVII